MRQARPKALYFSKAAVGGLLLAGFLAAALFSALPAQAAGKSEVAVMPFVKGRDPEDPAKSLTCPFGRLCYEDEELKENADLFLTEKLQEILLSRLEHRVVPLHIVEKAYDSRWLEPADQTPLDTARALGSSLGVDYVLAGNVWRFDERIGRSYGVKKSASVAFALHLIKVENGRTVWEKMFIEKQQPLSENLFRTREFIRRGARWLTAEELAEDGLEDIMQSFPLENGKD